MQQKTILLVEDEPLIALEIKEMLEAAGYLVLAAANEPEALSLAARWLPDVAILNFKTQHFPDGMALARLLRIRFFIKIIFITGAQQQDLENSDYFYAGHDILHKSFTRRQLREFLLPDRFLPFPETQATLTE